MIKMNKKLTLILMTVLIFALVIGMTGCGRDVATSNGEPGDNGNDEVYTMRIGTGAAGGNPQVKFMEVFKAYAEEMADGRLVVETYPAGQLGTLAQMVQSVQDGSVSGYLLTSNYYSTIVPEMEVFDLPGLFNDTAHLAWALINNETSLTPKLQAAGLDPLTWVPLNDFIFTLKRPVSKVADFKGMKIWVNPGLAIQMQVEALGMTPSILDMSDVVTSLQNNTIDAVMAGTGFIMPFNFQDVADYVVIAPRLGTVSPFMVSTKFMESLPEDLQATVREAAVKANREVVYDYAIQFQEECLQILIDKGMEAIYPDGKFQAEINEALLGVRDEYLEMKPEMRPVYEELKALAESVKSPYESADSLFTKKQ
jgi:TRAP-type C4-dicarboxylate transport system substrate-binding protein